MATQVSICNEALTLLGQPTISAINESNDRARPLNTVYDQTLKALLRMHRWNFAVAKASLTNLTETDEDYVPAWGYGYYYSLPSDCLRVIGTDNPDIVWKVETYSYTVDEVTTTASYLTTDESAAYIEYIRSFTSGTHESLFDPLFVQCFAALLAAKIAYKVTGRREDAALMLQIFQEALAEARLADSQESYTQHVEAHTWVDARGGSTSYRSTEEPTS